MKNQMLIARVFSSSESDLYKLWSSLFKLNLTSQDEFPEEEDRSPWYIQFMQSVAAWIASLFILAFGISFFNLFLDDLDTGFAAVMGIFYTALALVIYRTLADKQVFLNQMAFALSLCGLLSLGYGMTDWFSHINAEVFGLAWYLTFGGILLIQWYLIEHVSHQYVMSFGMIACLVGACYELGLLELVPSLIMILFAGVWLNHSKTAKHFAAMGALGYMLALWLVLIQLPLLISQSNFSNHGEFPHLAQWSNSLSVISTLIIALVLLSRILKPLSISITSKQGLSIIVALFALAGLSIVMTGLSASLLVLLIGFYIRERLIAVLGIVGMLSFIAWYYYNLQLPLLDKSIWLVALGLLLLFAKLVLNKLQPAELPLSGLQNIESLGNKQAKQGKDSDEV
ncbi:MULTISPECIES: DUF4401 domain-containing protein [unclassified Shewanella]|uniref:DUF4401 domain-containing protein n=1 Tax=unclassified Shewanella TaxID=196818 RepID=UPI001BBEBC43|nr:MULTISPECIES: DUF4401 domain-containing protein [unclassified Shewanella]GIU07748.1 hypothetical protein TUM4444_07670 [Shewanella sp. MBTL60-112-B1]GIU30380.1 hypothetical protein TUM4445_13660 [Shewanella sp. MBTL60-112-B2]